MKASVVIVMLLAVAVASAAHASEDTRPAKISTKAMAKHFSLSARVLMNMLGDDRDSRGYDFTVRLTSPAAEKIRIVVEKSENGREWRLVNYAADMATRGQAAFHRSKHDTGGCAPAAKACLYRVSLKSPNGMSETRADLAIWLGGRGTPVFKWGGYFGGGEREICVFDARKGKVRSTK